MHFVIYLPSAFYAAIAATIIETLQAVNDVRGEQLFSFEFVSPEARPVSKSGIAFQSKVRASRRIDVLLLLAGLRVDLEDTLRLLSRETDRVMPLIRLAQKQGAVIASTCGAAYMLAAAGALDGKRATISWWLKREAQRRFPQVRWEPSRLVVRQGRIYTSGAGFSGLDLLMTLLVDLGYKEEERQVRKLMVLPPLRRLQTPYEIPAIEAANPFEQKLSRLSAHHLRELNLGFLAERLGMSPRTLARMFLKELGSSPGKWIQERRIEAARALLEGTRFSIAEVCHRVGYEDLASFSRLFSKSTGMPPGEFRKHLRTD
jgi:transcriptional regulator GlxA family with amidase domain